MVDLAYEYGYSTHEAFSRAFKKYFGITPYRYRQRNIHPHFLTKKMLDMEALKKRIAHIDITPRIMSAAEQTVTGLAYTTSLNNREVYGYYEEFLGQIVPFIPAGNKTIYTVYQSDPSVNIRTLTDDTPYTIVIGVEKESLQSYPEEMKQYTLPGVTYAAFEIGNNVAAVGDTYLYIYNSWLPSSQYKLGRTSDYLTAELDGDNRVLNLTICIPVT